MASPYSHPTKKTRNKSAKRYQRVDSDQLEHLDSLPWSSSFPDYDDKSLSLLSGSNQLEGGFLSLEEIDESAYALEIPKDGKGYLKEMRQQKVKSKKRKCLRKMVKTCEENVESVTVTNSKRETEGDPVDESEYYAWNELRLHPLLMKSIHRLKFKEPTLIQKACISAAAHQGKDVIGAAETGSGKTLAFGLPILQRLLEEREKANNLLTKIEEAYEQISSRGFLRALIITPTRELAVQVSDHLNEVAKYTNIRVVPIVGGMSTEKQERLLKARPEIVVGTPGRLWQLISGGEIHLVELHSLSFFVLDEADCMIEKGHFHELQSIIDMLPLSTGSVEGRSRDTQNCVTVSSLQRKKRQTLVFSATIALSSDFRKKLQRGSVRTKQSDGLSSIETLSERAGMRTNAAVVDLTNTSIMADGLEESFILCREEDKDAYVYYIVSIHGQGRAIIFCKTTDLPKISSLLRILDINVCTLQGDMQQRVRLKHIDRFRGSEDSILVATDVAARGLDIPGVRTVIHYGLYSADVYVHRSGRTARASADGCSIALISPDDASKFTAMCKSFSKESFRQFPVDISYMPEVRKRVSLARQIEKVLRKNSQEKANRSWLERNAESVELVLEDNDSEDERVNAYKQKKASSIHLKKLQQELKVLLSHPLQPKSFSHRYPAGSGLSLLLQRQFEELARQRHDDSRNSGNVKKRRLMVIGQDCVEPLQALRSAGHEVRMDFTAVAEKRRNLDNLRRRGKRRENACMIKGESRGKN